MRKLLVLVLLLLSALWLYTSWYWYTCIIKGFCSNTPAIVELDDEYETEVASPNVVVEPVIEVLPEIVIEEVVETAVEPIVKQAPVPVEPEPVVVVEKKQCETLIVTPIRLGTENDTGDVKDLEDFLNAFEGESLEVNGVYEQADFDAVKRFQVKYGSEILTPWGIKNPTGYVFKTTTKKINEIYCSK